MLKYFILFSLLTNFYLNADEAQIQRCLQKIRQVPEAGELMKKIQRDGPIAFSTSNHPVIRKFGAVWDTDRRLILLSPESNRTEGEMIGSILFEMHNASVTSELMRLEQLAAAGKINRADYIKNVEYLEYLNSKRCAELTQKGIERKILPESARLPTYRDFNEHFYYQKMSGHSEAVGKIYDQIQLENS